MKRNSLTVLVGVLLLVIFVLLLFTFQVRQTQIALVTTFDNVSGRVEEPGFKWKWPPPIQRVYKFDKRIQSFEQDKIDETPTKDNYNLIIQVYAGWRISKPDLFFSSFPAGTVAAAQPALEALIRGAKIQVVGKHPFTDFVSSDTNQLKFAEIEQEMLRAIQPPALDNYGIEIKFLGIKKLGLPESVTQKVFDRMTAERQAVINSLQGHGEARASIIRSAADSERERILAHASAEATRIRGQADGEAAKSYAAFEKDRDLAMFLTDLRALEAVTKDRTTLILDERTRPFNLMTRPATNGLPSASTNQWNKGFAPNVPASSIGTGATAAKNSP